MSRKPPERQVPFSEKVKKFDQKYRVFIWHVLLIILVFVIIIYISLKSFHLAATSYAALPDIKDTWNLSAILFSSAQVSLFVISILIGLLTIVGWQAVERKIQENVEKATTERLAILEKEVRGRSFAILGYTIAEKSAPRDFSKPTDEVEARLREAVQYCEQAYNFLKGTDLPAEYMALNNLLTYSCDLHDSQRRGYILECAHRLREAAEEHNSQNLLLTYCRTILEFSLEPKEKGEACLIVNAIRERGGLGEKQKREADHLASLCNATLAGHLAAR